jgi:hypothetical protein
LAIALGALAVGCADLREYTDAQLIGSRNHYLARRSWKANAGRVGGQCKHPVEFRQGYLDGYLAVAEGRGSCPPVMPPEDFWGACYQDACGQERINGWFAGYNEGVVAASRDGVSGVTQIPSWCEPEGGGCGPMVGKPPGLVAPVPTRKPRRGDPPVRATLPPEDDTPKSSTEKSDEKSAPPRKDTPEKDALDDPLPSAPSKSAPKKTEESSALPLNPFAPRSSKKTASPADGVPANPPVLNGQQTLKSSKTIESETPRPTKTIDEDAGSSVPEVPTPPKAEFKPRSAPRTPAIEPASAKIRRVDPPEDEGDWETPHDRTPRRQLAGRPKDRDLE